MPEALIENALNKLASGQERAFLIVEDDQSGKFVQFAGSRAEPLVLDLPVHQLTSDSRGRAERVLSEYGDITTSSDALQVVLGRDVSRASAIAVRVFRDVFSLHDELQLRVLDEESAQASDAPEEDICERCGECGAGRRQLMLYPWWYALFGEHSRRQWFCTRCLRIMRVYAVVGFLLLAILVSGLVGVSIWLIM